MNRRRIAAAGIVVLAIAIVAGALRVALHANRLLVPALVLRGTDPAGAVAPPFPSRIARSFHERWDSPTHGPREIALTFDDGPYAVSTPLLLDVLRDLRVHSTFFLIGRDVEQFPGLARRIATDGHEIANHTYTHPDLDRLSASAIRSELHLGARALGSFSRSRSVTEYMRPPHGRYTVETLKAVQAAGYDVVLWNDDPGDWRTVPAASIEEHILAHATAPDIVLLHSGKPATIEMLPALVADFRAAGYRFVTVGELLRDVPADRIVHPEHLSIRSIDG